MGVKGGDGGWAGCSVSEAEGGGEGEGCGGEGTDASAEAAAGAEEGNDADSAEPCASAAGDEGEGEGCDCEGPEASAEAAAEAEEGDDVDGAESSGADDGRPSSTLGERTTDPGFDESISGVGSGLYLRCCSVSTRTRVVVCLESFATGEIGTSGLPKLAICRLAILMPEPRLRALHCLSTGSGAECLDLAKYFWSLCRVGFRLLAIMIRERREFLLDADFGDMEDSAIEPGLTGPWTDILFFGLFVSLSLLFFCCHLCWAVVVPDCYFSPSMGARSSVASIRQNEGKREERRLMEGRREWIEEKVCSMQQEAD